MRKKEKIFQTFMGSSFVREESDKDVLLIIKLGCYLYVNNFEMGVGRRKPYILLDSPDIGYLNAVLYARGSFNFPGVGMDLNVFISPMCEYERLHFLEQKTNFLLLEAHHISEVIS